MRIAGLVSALIAATAASVTAAQETRTAPAEQAAPTATIAEVAWLAGSWTGEGIGGAAASETWLPAVGGTMVGVFVQQAPEGGIRFSELLYLSEDAGSLVLKLKHFNADLTGWEDKDGMVRFRLIGIEPCAAYFEGLTFRCDGQDGLVAAVLMKTADGKGSELVFRFKRRG